MSNYGKLTRQEMSKAFNDEIDGINEQLAQTAKGNKPSWSVWEEFEQRAINVKWYGAKGDGTTDDTQSIQNALNEGGLIFIPSGVYIVSGLNITKNTTIIGTGKKESILKHIGNATSNNLLRQFVGNELTITNIGFDGNYQSQAEKNVLLWIEDNTTLENCYLTNGGMGVFATGNIEKKIVIDKSHFINMGEHKGVAGTDTHCIKVRGRFNYVNVTNCMFKHGSISQPGVAPSGISVSQSDTTDGHLESKGYPSLTITNNTFIGMGQWHSNNISGAIDLYTQANKSIIANNKFLKSRFTPLKLQNSREIICVNNQIEGFDGEEPPNTTWGILVEGNARSYSPTQYNFIVKGNIVKNLPFSRGIGVVGGDEGRTIVEGNIIENVVVYGIHSSRNKKITISSNIIKDVLNIGSFLGTGINLSNNPHVVIVGTHIENATVFGCRFQNNGFILFNGCTFYESNFSMRGDNFIELQVTSCDLNHNQSECFRFDGGNNERLVLLANKANKAPLNTFLDNVDRVDQLINNWNVAQ